MIYCLFKARNQLINISNTNYQLRELIMPLLQTKEPRITRSYRVKPELDRRFTQATEKDARVKSRIIEQAVERYCVASGI